MAPPTPPADDFTARVRDPGYTPRVRDLDRLVELVAAEDEELVKAAERAILRIDPQHLGRVTGELVSHARTAPHPLRSRLTRVVGRLARGAPDEVSAVARAWLNEALADADPKTRRAAARALGTLPAQAASERALLDAWDATERDEARGDEAASIAADRKTLAEALGKLGSVAARERLARAGSSAVGLGRAAARATIMLEREAARATPGAIDLAREAPSPLRVRFHARAGLAPIVADEIPGELEPRATGPGLVEATLRGPLARAAKIRTATHFGFPLEPIMLVGGRDASEALAEAVASALLSAQATTIFRAFTKDEGAIRFRLAWTRGGHRRALAWRCAELVRQRSSALVNDPTASTWEVVVDDRWGGRLEIELVPRGYDDARFSYRHGTVPASSHPTIAAAIARVAPRRDDDVVWDPFVGAGAELVERARLGPYRALYGTDVAAEALEAARTNLAAAGLEDTTLAQADALDYAPPGLTLVLSNPPMGRRVQRGSHGVVLEQFLTHVAEVLAPGGALVLTLPEPARLGAHAARAGLVLERAWNVDMGGFDAALSVFTKAALGREPRGGPRPAPRRGPPPRR